MTSTRDQATLDRKLIDAVLNESWEKIHRLLIQGANPNYTYDGYSTLYDYVYSSSPLEIELVFLEKNASLLSRQTGLMDFANAVIVEPQRKLGTKIDLKGLCFGEQQSAMDVYFLGDKETEHYFE